MRSEIRNDALSPFVSQLMDAIAREEPVMAALGVNEGAVLAVVDECARLLADQPIRIIRIRGSQGSPLTLSRVVQELGAAERGGVPMDDDELIVRVLANRSKNQERVVLIVEQAELLPVRTLTFLQVISTVFGGNTPKLQLLFVGHTEFQHLIEKGELSGIHERLETIIQVAGTPINAVSSIASLPDLDDVHPPRDAFAIPTISRRTKVLALSLASVIIVATTFAVIQRAAHDAGSEAGVAAPVSGSTRTGPQATGTLTQAPRSDSPRVPDPSAQATTQPTAPEPPRLPTPSQPDNRDEGPAAANQPGKRRARPTEEQLVRLRAEFERFLAQTEWGAKRQSETERSRLFNEFLQWNYGASGIGSDPSQPAEPATPLPRARVTVHFLTNSANAREKARQLAATLLPSVVFARTRPVADVPKTFELRYFAQEDEALANSLAHALQAPDADWTVRLMPDFRTAPTAHLIELWLPLR